MRTLAALLLLAPALAHADVPRPPPAAATAIALPGGPGPIKMDYLAYEPAANRVWVPAGNSGRVDLIDATSGKVTAIDGFAHTDKGGPSSVTVGDGVVYVGNRADSKVCAVDPKSLAIGACVAVASSPDGIAWVAATRELWVTTPRDSSLTIFELGRAGALVFKQTLKLDGEPEGYAVDAARGVFYTNLEDRDRTLAFDVRTKREIARWEPHCGKAGPRGLALVDERRMLVVACTDGAVVLDLAHDGKPLGRLTTGGGVDNIDYAPARHQLFVASGADGKLTVATVDAHGALAAGRTVATAPGARVVVVDRAGAAYVADSAGGRVWRVLP